MARHFSSPLLRLRLQMYSPTAMYSSSASRRVLAAGPRLGCPGGIDHAVARPLQLGRHKTTKKYM